MTTKRGVIVEDAMSVTEADALARMLSGVDERVERLEKSSPCRIDHAALARLIDGLDARIEAAVVRALVSHTQSMADDKDPHMPPVVRRAADVATRHWWGGVSDRGMKLVLSALIVAVLIWLGSLGIVFRGVPKE